MAETKRLRVSKACDSCRRKKVKCDALHPLCTNCETFGYECTYNDPTKKRGPPKGYIEAIEARLHRMEGLLGGLVKDKDPRAEIVRAELDAMAREAEMTGLKLRRSRAYEEINHKIGAGSSASASTTPTSLSTSMATGLSISSPLHGKKTASKHPAPVQNASYPGAPSHQIQPNPAIPGGPGAMNTMPTSSRHPGGLQPSPIPATHVDPARPYDPLYGSSSGRGQPTPYYPPSQQFQSVHNQHSSPNHSSNGSHMGSSHGMNGLGLQDIPPSMDMHGQYSGHPRQHHFPPYPPYSNVNHHHHNGASNEKQTLDEIRMQFMTKTLPQQTRRPPSSPSQRSMQEEQMQSPSQVQQQQPAQPPPSHPLTGYLPEDNVDIGQQLVMPAPDVIDHLLEVHFGHVHPVLPMLHYKTLSDQIHQKKSAPHLTFAILGLASRFSNNPVFRNPQPGIPRPPCTIFYERAKFFIKNEYDNSQMSTIQALLLMAVQQMGFCESQRAWLYVGMAIRMAQDLGLNKEPSDQEKERDPVLAELRKRTWWSCYVVERLVCAGLGSILEFIQARAADRQAEKENNGDSSSGTGSSGSAGHHTKGAGLNSFTHSPSLARELEKSIFQVDTSQAAFSALDKALMEWRQQLPENLRDPTPSSPHFGLFLHLTYNTLLILLHRPEIPYSATSASLCTQAAMTITDIIEILIKARALSSMFISILYAIFSAGIIHFMNIPGAKRPSRATSPAPTAASSPSVHSTPRFGSNGSGSGGNVSNGQQSLQPSSAADQPASLTAKTNLKRCIDALRFLASHWLSAARRAKVLEDLLDLKHVSLRDLEEDTFQTVNLDPDWTSNTGYGLALRGPRERHDKLRQRCRSKVMAIQSLLANDDDHHHPYHKKSQQQRQSRSMSNDGLQPLEQDADMSVASEPSSDPQQQHQQHPNGVQIKTDPDVSMEQAPAAGIIMSDLSSALQTSTSSLPGVAPSTNTSQDGLLVDHAMKDVSLPTTNEITTANNNTTGLGFDPMMILASDPMALEATQSPQLSSVVNTEAIMAGLGLTSSTGSPMPTSVSTPVPMSVPMTLPMASSTPLLNGGSANMFDPFSMPSSITFPLEGGSSSNSTNTQTGTSGLSADTTAALNATKSSPQTVLQSETGSTSSPMSSLTQEPSVGQQQQSTSQSSVSDKTTVAALRSTGGVSVGSPTWEYHGQMGKPAATRTGLSIQEQELQDLEWNDMPVTLGLDEWMAYIGALMMRWLASGESSPKATPPSF
ncbi:hypothetical protein BGW42_004216 [Actinomortierella wolfii]|nr:hypothetical protein BGW42_004216 [Actinomortierella wolfii]